MHRRRIYKSSFGACRDQATTSYTAISDTLWQKDLEEWKMNQSMHILYGTQVINIVSSSGVNLQNQLYNPVNPVPEPSTMILVGTGIAGLIAVRRKKKE